MILLRQVVETAPMMKVLLVVVAMLLEGEPLHQQLLPIQLIPVETVMAMETEMEEIHYLHNQFNQVSSKVYGIVGLVVGWTNLMVYF